MPNNGIRPKIILITEVRKLEFTDFDSHSPSKNIEIIVFYFYTTQYLFFLNWIIESNIRITIPTIPNGIIYGP